MEDTHAPETRGSPAAKEEIENWQLCKADSTRRLAMSDLIDVLKNGILGRGKSDSNTSSYSWGSVKSLIAEVNADRTDDLYREGEEAAVVIAEKESHRWAAIACNTVRTAAGECLAHYMWSLYSTDRQQGCTSGTLVLHCC